MSEKSRQPSPHLHVSKLPEVVSKLSRQENGQPDRNRPLGKIEHEHQDSIRPAENSANIGGADVATAMLKDIDAAHSGNDIAERDRAEEIAGQHGKGCNKPRHGNHYMIR